MEKRKTNIDMLKMRLRSSQKSKLMGFNRLVRKLIASMTSTEKEAGDGVDKPPLQNQEREIKQVQPKKKQITDEDGHFKYKLKDNIFHYQIETTLGEGTFGKVLECRDVNTSKKYAVKVIRNIKRYREAAKLEINCLEKMEVLNKSKKSYIVNMIDSFDMNGHICLVFPILGESTYDFQKANDFLPYQFNDIKNMAYQMLKAIEFMHEAKCTHTDMKPENVLFRYKHNYDTVFNGRKRRNEKRLNNSEIVLIDLGSAVFEWEHHSKVVSTRHYRAPEVIYGLPWNHKIDIWSIACILFEYYTGKTMFQTHDNCEHLAMMDKTIGSPPNSFAKKCKHPFYTRVGTNYVLNWDENTEDGVYVKTNCKPLEKYCVRITSPDHINFFNLLQSMLVYDPAKRPDATDCLRHPFFNEFNSISRRFSQQSIQMRQRIRQGSTRTLSSSSSLISSFNSNPSC